MKKDICKEWRITDNEYQKLDESWGKLAEHQSWDLFHRNTRNNHTDEQTDIAQEIRIALMKAGSYYKRQVYIEKCLELCQKHIKDIFTSLIVNNLLDLWNKKTKHGGKRQKFGSNQEYILFKLVRKLVPKKERPNRNAELQIDLRFNAYCKSITWNRAKAMGKKITKERVIRGNCVSISEYDFLC